MIKRTLKSVLLIVVACLYALVPVKAFALAGAHSYTNNDTGDVYLGGSYIELGLSSLGSFGTNGHDLIKVPGPPNTLAPVEIPNGFYGTATRTNIGMSTNPAGFGNNPDLRMDFFMPGNPEERWAVGYKVAGTPTIGSNNLASPDGHSSDIADNTVTNQSSGDLLQATSVGTLNSALKTTQVISFKQNDRYFKNEVTLQNVSSDNIDSVRFMRSVDPDNTVDQYIVNNRPLLKPTLELTAQSS